MIHRTVVVVAMVGLTFAAAAYAVNPTPLQNAYWRAEEGTAGTNVPTGPNAVLDSINANHMQTYSTTSAPLYTPIVPAGIIPQTGATNKLALQFSGGQDIYTLGGAPPDGKPINLPITSAFTLEASFNASAVGGGAFHGIVGKDGQPNPNGGEQTLVMKVRGDNSLLQFEQFDGAGNRCQVSSLNTIAPDRWYHAAVVNDGSTLSLYLNSNDGNGYVLQGSTAVSGALWQIESPWTIGRGMFNNNPADWFQGLIDEVRLSNTALAPSQFLFVPEPATLVLLALGGVGLLRIGRRA